MALKWKLLLVLMLTVTLGGCSTSSEPDGSTSPAPATSEEPTTATSPGTSESTAGRGEEPTAAARNSGITAPPQAAYSSAVGSLEPWISPSGNIVCAGSIVLPDEDEGETGPDTSVVGCRVDGAKWSIPTDDTMTCTDGWAGDAWEEHELWLVGTAEGGNCRGTNMFDGDEIWTLEYGEEVRIGDAVCHSLRTGMLCVDRKTGSGFRAARASYDLFNVEPAD